MTLPSLDRLEAAAEIVYRALPATPQIRWPLLCTRAGTEVWVKHENHLPLGAFKLRGGLVYMEELRKEQPDLAGVIAATRGNHGQSVAFAASRAGLKAVIVVPHHNSPEKNEAMRSLGARLIEHGSDFQQAFEHAGELARVERLHFVPSFDLTLVRGVASYALELYRGVPGLQAIYVPIGLGSGICGCIAARNALGLDIEIIGVTAASAPAYERSLLTGGVVEAEVQPTIADGMACRTPDPRALQILADNVSRIVTVEEEEIRAAMRHLFTDTHNTAEGAGAAALAAVLKDASRVRGRRVAIVLTGGNVDSEKFAHVLLGKK